MAQEIRRFCELPQRSITLAEMFRAGQTPESLLENARLLHKELPIRLARRADELAKMPYGLSGMEPVQRVRSWYVRSFNEMISMRAPATEADEAAFAAVLEGVLDRHSAVVPTMAQGILQLKDQIGAGAVDECPFLQDFLDRFYMARIGVRMLISQHVALHAPANGFIGILGENVRPADEAEAAVENASRLCDRNYGRYPDVEIDGDLDADIVYVPGHLHHMLHELLKNAMRAVVETHSDREMLPPVQLTVACDEDEFLIKISDQGGGIPREQLPEIWNYLYTTADRPKEADYDQIHGGLAQAPMAGFGYGLPISKLYARYFGGDLDLVTMDGYGTTAYLYLSRLGGSTEPLPK